MQDKEVRGLVLEKFYELRHKQDNVSLEEIQSVLPGDLARVGNICEQLAENGLIKWKSMKAQGGIFGGAGKITAAGVDVVDGDVPASFSITLHDNRITVNQSTGIVVGSNNSQSINIDKRRIESEIDRSDVSEDEKGVAKLLLKQVVSNPTLWAVTSGFFAGGAQ